MTRAQNEAKIMEPFYEEWLLSIRTDNSNNGNNGAGTPEVSPGGPGPSGPGVLTAECTDDLFCPQCSYNLRGLINNRCPECGHPFDRATLPTSRIPWAHRQHLGRFRAYWRTVAFAMRHTDQLGEEIARPVSYRDAQRFRWITIGHVMVPAIGVSIYGFTFANGAYVLNSPSFEAAMWGTLLVSLALFLAAMTGLPSYSFHPRTLTIEKQNRAIALSYYTCAPLAMMPLTGTLGLIAWIFYDNTVSATATILLALFVCSVVVQVVAFWTSLLRTLRRTTRCSMNHAIAVGGTVPLGWFFLAGLILLGIPLLCAYVVLLLIGLGF